MVRLSTYSLIIPVSYERIMKKPGNFFKIVQSEDSGNLDISGILESILTTFRIVGRLLNINPGKSVI